MSPSCAIQGHLVAVARAGVYRARRYCLGDQKKKKWTGNVACMGEVKKSYNISMDIFQGTKWRW